MYAAMGPHFDQLARPRHNVLVCGTCALASEANFITDYYYYATAGGAKLWVSGHSYPVATNVDLYAVEEIPHDHANCTIRHRPCRCLLWK